MSRFYSGGRSRARGGYRGGFYDNGGSRFYKERRDYGESSMSESRVQLEIARKLVDTLIGGGRQGAEHLFSDGAGGAPFRRPRTGYDRLAATSDRRFSAGEIVRRQPPFRDHSHQYEPARRGHRGHGAAFATAASPRRYGFASGDRGRIKTGRPFVAGKSFMPLRCPHCKLRCSTFSQYRDHQLGREHMSAMQLVAARVRTELTRMRLAQSDAQRKLEAEQQQPDFGERPQLTCDLCKLQYREVDGVKHDETEWHVKLKAYQKAECQLCSSSYPSRISYEKHLGSITHLEKVYQTEKSDAAAFKQGDFLTLDEVGDVDVNEETVGVSAAADSAAAKHTTDSASASATANSATQATAAAAAQQPRQMLKQLGQYDGKRSVASELMRKTEVYHCDLCDIYIKITAKIGAVLQKHCTSRKHFDNYHKLLAKQAEEAEQAAAEAVARQQHKVKKQQQQPAAHKHTDQHADDDGPAMSGEDRVVRGAVDQMDSSHKMDDDDLVTENGDVIDRRVVRSTDGAQAQPAASATSVTSWDHMDDKFILGDEQDDIKDD